MKIRQGFVSNSSSSSFVCFGYKCTTEELSKLLQCDKDTVHEKLEESSVDFIYNSEGKGSPFFIGICKQFNETYWEDVELDVNFNTNNSIKYIREVIKYNGPLKLYAGSICC